MFDPKMMRFGMAMSSATISMGALMYGGYWLGNLLDVKFGSAPFIMFGLILLGLFSGLAWIVFVANKTKI